MKTYKEVLNEASKKSTVLKELSEEESAQLKRCLLEIFLHVTKICQTHGLRYMLSGGSCLGAVRHHGFIPWDDDLDVMMPRPDYERLLGLLDEGELGDEYSYTCPNRRMDSPTMFLKVFRNDTVMIELGGEKSPYPQKVFIDVFPIDGAPANLFMRKLKGYMANSLRLAANTVYDSHPLTESQRFFYGQNLELASMMKKRRIFGKLFSFISHKRWASWFDSFVSNADMSGYVCIPTGRKLYAGEVFLAKDFLSPVECLFEGIKVPIPSNFHEYLSNLYGDYMTLPDEDKRERHFFVDMIIPGL